jgi:hypothetical protein
VCLRGNAGIVNDPNKWCDEHDDPTYIVDLIRKVTTVSVETVVLVERLSQLFSRRGKKASGEPPYVAHLAP